MEGNHDRGLSNIMSHLVGVKVYEEYEWEFEGRHHLAIHGHQFDRFAVNNLLLSTVGTLSASATAETRFQGQGLLAFSGSLECPLVTAFHESGCRALWLHARLRHADRVFLRPHPPGNSAANAMASLTTIPAAGRIFRRPT